MTLSLKKSEKEAKARELLEDYGVDLADLAEMLENADD